MMLPYFPELQNDELFYSGAARFGAMMGFRNNNDISRWLFDAKVSLSSIDFPRRLGVFVKKLESDCPLTPSNIIESHTLLPYYAPFRPLDRVVGARQAMLDDGATTVEACLGIPGNSSMQRSRTPRFCAACCEEDDIHLDIPAWRRVHQCSGVYVCPLHGTPIYTVPPAALVMDSRYSYLTLTPKLKEIAEPVLRPTGWSQELLLSLARETAWLLEHGTEVGSHEPIAIADRLLQVLKDRGWVMGGKAGRLKTVALLNAIEKRYGGEELGVAGLQFKNTTRPWVKRVLAPYGTVQHPLYYLVLCNFLDIKIADLLSFEPIVTRTRLDEPLEEVADAPRQSRQKPPLDWRKASLDQRLRDSKQVWVEIVGKNPTLNRWQLYRLAGGYHSFLLTHDPDWLELHLPPSKIEARGAAIHRHRDRWLSQRRSTPTASRAELQRLLKVTYNYLNKHDREWLQENSPEMTRPGPKSSVADVELQVRLRSAFTALMRSPGRPTRITKYALYRAAGLRGNFSLHASARLPGSATYLSAVTETRLTFARRCLDWALDTARSGGVLISYDDFVRLVSCELKHSEPLRTEVHSAYTQLIDMFRESADTGRQDT